MKRLIFFWGTILFLALLLCACENKQENDKVYTVGIVSMNHHVDEVLAGFRSGMEERGYVAGNNLSYIYRGPFDDLDQLKKHVSELISQEVDLIYTITTPATKAAQNMTKTTQTPVLFGPMMSPVSAGLVTELYSPHNTITGVQVRGGTEKTVFFLMKFKPQLKNIYVPFHVGNEPAKVGLADLKKSADKFGLQVLTADFHNAEELEAVLRNIPVEAESIWLSNSHLAVAMAPEIVATANKRKIPVASPLDQSATGVLVTYAPRHAKIGEQISRLADKLLQGVKISSLPIETADFYLTINLKTAKVLGLDPPVDLLNQADFIIR